MNHLTALAIKILFQGTVILSILPIFEQASLTNLIWISLIVTGASYVIGDLFILPRFGNTIATLADFALVSVAIWALAGMFLNISAWTAALTSGLAIAICEILFHAYMNENVLTKEETDSKVIPFPGNRRLQTEFAEENEVRPKPDNDDNHDKK